MITSVALAAASAGGAFAADAAPAAAAQVQELVVTGSRIPQPNLTSIAPVTSVGSNEVKLTGSARVEDLLNSLPQVVSEQGIHTSNGSPGIATVSLRGLGSNRTLVLIDGRRLVPGDPVVPVADLNFIPDALIDRVEVDTAGASAVYGADAVAGVVNFKMKRNFEGVRLEANYGVSQHNNNNAVAQAANAAKGFVTPKGSIFDGNQVDVTAIIGVNSPDGKGNIEGYVSYRHTNPVQEKARDYSNCNLKASTKGFACSGSGTIPLGQFLVYGPNFSLPPGASSAPAVTLDTANPGNFRPKLDSDVYNFAPLNYYQRPDERYSGGFFAHYDISKQVQAYSEFMFMDDHTVGSAAPSGIFGSTFNIHCNNPLLSANEVQTICGQYGLTPTQSNNSVIILRRNAEGGPRLDDFRHTDYRAVVGLKGDLGNNWHYDVYGQYSAAIFANRYANDISKSRLNNALNAVTDPKTGKTVCASVLDGTDPNCVPYNIWKPGGVTPDQIAYISVPGFKTGQTIEQVVSAAVTGDLGAYGIKSPLAHDGFGVAIGAEYRREKLDDNTDIEFTTGDLEGQGAKTPSTHGAYSVREIFGEARIPLVQDMPFVKALSAELGYRFSNYSSIGDTNAYKISGEWAINDDLRVRGGFNRSVRAPNIVELFTPDSLGLDGSKDFCAGPTPAQTAAQCANSGVTAVQYGHIIANPANQYNGIVGGNPNLKQESANTYSLGVVFNSHRFLPGLTISADYYSIKINNVIQGIGADNILKQCGLTGLAQFCSLVTRAPGTASLWLGTNGFIRDTAQNLGFLKTSGIDFAAGYKTKFSDLGLGDFGGIAIDFLGTYTHDYQVYNGIPNQAVLQCVGVYGTICQGSSTPLGGPAPTFKSKTRLTWSTPYHGLDVSLAWRYMGAVNLDTGQTNLADSHISAYNWFDLAASFRVKDRYTFRAGVNNLFDRDPPIIGSGELPNASIGNGNTFPGAYDNQGRYIFTSVTADF